MLKSKIQNPKSKISKQKFYYLSFALCNLFVICALSFAILMSGCATVIESAKGIAGTSTRALEKSRKNAITRTFNYDYSACYAKTLEILKHINTYIYKRSIKKHMIAVYVSEEDTTQVGIFFKEIDASHTQIEVSSRSTYAKETISSTLFSSLEKSPQ